MVDAKKIACEVFDIEADSILKLKNRIDENFEKMVDALANCKGRVIVCGIGKSGNIAKKIAATFASTGTPSFFVHPAEAFHGDLGMLTKDDTVIAISYSGETEEMIKLIPSFRDIGNTFVSMTGNVDSTIAKNSHFHINVKVEKEACPLQLAPTSSTTATLAMGDAIAVILMKKRGFTPEHFAKFHPGGNLGRKLLTSVRDVMKTGVLPLINEGDSIEKIIPVMTSSRLGLAIIAENNFTLKGIITDGDLRRAFEKYSFDGLKNIKARDIMTTNPKTVSPDAKLYEAEEIMNSHKITSLGVVENGLICGIIQIYDIT